MPGASIAHLGSLRARWLALLVGKSQSLVDLEGVVVNQVANKQEQQLHKRLLCFIYIDFFTRLRHQLKKKAPARGLAHLHFNYRARATNRLESRIALSNWIDRKQARVVVDQL